jgi:hypothetical protein
MRCFALLAILLTTQPIHAQRIDWQHANLHLDDSTLPATNLSPHQQASIRTFILHTLSDDCSAYPGGPGTFTYSSALLGRPHIVYVSPDGGCLRGGQGANASLWLVDTSGGRLHLIATPQQGFEGWGLAIQPHISHRLHDIVTAWHMSASETRLTYLRFDGTLYRTISQTSQVPCQTLPAHPYESGLCVKPDATR